VCSLGDHGAPGRPKHSQICRIAARTSPTAMDASLAPASVPRSTRRFQLVEVVCRRGSTARQHKRVTSSSRGRAAPRARAGTTQPAGAKVAANLEGRPHAPFHRAEHTPLATHATRRTRTRSTFCAAVWFRACLGFDHDEAPDASARGASDVAWREFEGMQRGLCPLAS